MDATDSALSRLLSEISWEGDACKYRDGGLGLENVLTVEVFQALDFLPRGEFLAHIFQSAIGGSSPALQTLIQEIETVTVRLLPGNVYLAKDPPEGKGRFYVQPDAVLDCSLAYCMLEAKRIKRGAFMPEQLAREFIGVLKNAGARNPLLLLVLPSPPPVPVKGHGRLSLRDAIASCLPVVLERTDGEFPPVDELCSRIDSVVAYTTWQRISDEIEASLKDFSHVDGSVQGCVRRLAQAALGAIQRHGLKRSPPDPLSLVQAV
jgi:hypothetical protein